MKKTEAKHDECLYISEMINSTDNMNLLVDKLFILLVKIQNEGKDFSETKHFLNKLITLSPQSTSDIFNWLKENQDEPKNVFFLGIFSFYNIINLNENSSKGFTYFLK